ncbi:MAG: gamma-butyrobetaine hydroxylase-like domain-containing protein [Acidimicrobiia bacterium]
MDQPSRIVLERDGRLLLTWPDGQVTDLSADLLRRSCPCAVCRESPGSWVTPATRIRTVEPAGAYGLRILFEGHESGIFSYDYLRLLDSPSG